MVPINELWGDHAARSFPLKSTSGTNWSPAIEGKGCIRRASRQLLLVCGLVPRAITEPLPWSCYYVCRGYVEEPRNSTSTCPSEGKDSSGVVLPRVRSSAWQKSREYRNVNAKGHERGTNTARSLTQCSVFLIMIKADSETLIRERIRNLFYQYEK